MKLRIFLFILVFLVFAFLILISWLGLTHIPISTVNLFAAPSPTAAASPIPTSTVLTSPTPTATSEPSASEKIVATISNFEKDVVGPILAVVNLIAVFVITGLGIFLFWRIILLTQKSILIIETITNSTGHDDLNKKLTGLTQLAREELVKTLEVMSYRIKHYGYLGPEEYKPPEKFLIPVGASSDKLSTLLKSLQEATTGELKTAIQVINLMFPPRGTKVTITLQSKGDMHEILGVSLEVTDLRSQQEPVLYTVWEEEAVSKASSNSESNASDVNLDSQSTAAQNSSITPESLAKNSTTERYLMEKLLSFFTRKSNSPSASHQSEENTEALAAYRLGTIYAEHGALNQAKNYYEEAVKKQPSNVKAEDALKHILKTKKTLEERYAKLLRPVTRWLTIELTRRSMASHERRILFEKGRNIYKAKVYNFMGEFHVSAADEDSSFFYELAIGDYEEAISLYEQWYQPYRNLAIAYSYRGVKKKEKNIEDQKEAIRHYNRALKHSHQFLDRCNKNDSKRMKILHRYYDLTRGHQLPFLTSKISIWIENERRIMLGKALAQWWLEDYKETPEGEKKVEDVIERYFENQGPWNWDETKEMDSALLYDLATWYAKVYEKNNADAEAMQKARRYLAYSLARDMNRRYSAKDDSEIKGIIGGLDSVIDELEEKIAEVPNLPMLTGGDFSRSINEVLQKANWS
jgi:tetratricopeptide (TPR) repeat protein